MKSFKKIFLFGQPLLAIIFLINVNVKSQGLTSSDTVRLNEVELDSIKFFLQEDFLNIEYALRDTAAVQLDGKTYIIPYKITARTYVEFRRQPRLYKLSGVSLSEQKELASYIKELFANPRERLKEKISAKNWKKSSVYINYFAPYDPNPLTDEDKTSDDELKEFMAEEGEGFVAQGYESFPLPQTIDIEVDLTTTPKIVTILGLEFDFDKLDKKFQHLLLDFGDTKNERNRKTYNIIK